MNGDNGHHGKLYSINPHSLCNGKKYRHAESNTRNCINKATKKPPAKERLQNELGHIPTVRELADELNVSEETILEALESNRAFSTYSLDQKLDVEEENDSSPFEKYLGEEDPGYENMEMLNLLEKVMADLSETEKEIVRKRFLQEMTQREVASALGLSQMAISRIEKAMRKKFQTEYRK